MDLGKNLIPILANQGILITGGYSSVPGTSKSVEIWSPDDSAFYHHYQMMIDISTHKRISRYVEEVTTFRVWHSCVTFSDGNWTVTHNITFSQRWGHTSWYTKGGTFLMGGGKFASDSIIIKADGSVERGFKMKNNTNYACSIPDGGESKAKNKRKQFLQQPIRTFKILVIDQSQAWKCYAAFRSFMRIPLTPRGYNHMTLATATRYNSDGYVANLPSMISGRYSHGCSGYYNDEDKLVYLVVGGFTEHGSGRLDTTEIFLDGHHHWRQVNSLPYHVSGLKATTLNNRVIAFGGYDDPKHNNYLNEILEFKPSNNSWVKIGEMLKKRSYHGVSVVDISKVEKYCL